MRALGGSCQVPLGGYAIIDNGQLWLRGFVATADGKEMVSAELRGNPADDEALGLQLAVIYLPPLQIIFQTVPLTVIDLVSCLGMGCVIFMAIELKKFVWRSEVVA